MSMTRSRIAIILDENTSGDASRYEAHKGYFCGVHDAGGMGFGIPFFPELIDSVPVEFDGLLIVGGRFAYPEGWYVDGEISRAPHSERLQIDLGLIGAFLGAGKPILGICAGMQALACLNGSRMCPDIAALMPSAIAHDKAGQLHSADVIPDTLLARTLGVASLDINSFHREAVVETGPGVTVCARAADGVIEAIEIEGAPFALGIQWHQERFVGTDHPGNRIFEAFVSACRG